MHYTYKTKDTCSSQIEFDYDGGVITNITFTNGCNGNLKTISRLLDGSTPEYIISKCEGILCGRRPTSCSDQLAKAIKKVI